MPAADDRDRRATGHQGGLVRLAVDADRQARHDRCLDPSHGAGDPRRQPPPADRGVPGSDHGDGPRGSSASRLPLTNRRCGGSAIAARRWGYSGSSRVTTSIPCGSARASQALTAASAIASASVELIGWRRARPSTRCSPGVAARLAPGDVASVRIAIPEPYRTGALRGRRVPARERRRGPSRRRVPATAAAADGIVGPGGGSATGPGCSRPARQLASASARRSAGERNRAASSSWGMPTAGAPPRSAIVRATRSSRSVPRPDRRSCSDSWTAASRHRVETAAGAQRAARQPAVEPSTPRRSVCRARVTAIRRATAADPPAPARRPAPIRDTRHRDPQVDPVAERAGDTVRVALDDRGRAVAAPGVVAGEPAGTGVHRGATLEARREGRCAPDPRDRDPPPQRLAKGFEHVPPELGQLVEKQDAAVQASPRRATGAAAADHRGVRRRVMGRTERRLRMSRAMGRSPAADATTVTSSAAASSSGGSSGDRPRQQRLARSRRPTNTIPCRRQRDLEPAACLELAATSDRSGTGHIIETTSGGLPSTARSPPSSIRGRLTATRRDRRLRTRSTTSPIVSTGASSTRSDQPRLGRGGSRHDDPPVAPPRGVDHRQDPGHRADLAAERSSDHRPADSVGRTCSEPAGSPARSRDRARRPPCAARPGEVDRDAAWRVLEAGVAQRAADPFASLLERRVGKADDREAGQAGATSTSTRITRPARPTSVAEETVASTPGPYRAALTCGLSAVVGAVISAARCLLAARREGGLRFPRRLVDLWRTGGASRRAASRTS